MNEEPNKKLTEYFEEPMTTDERAQVRFLLMMLARFVAAVIVAALIMGFVVMYVI